MITQNGPAAIAAVLGWLLEGHSEADIKEAIATKGLGDPVILLKSAAVELVSAGQFESDALRGFCFMAYQAIYRKTMEIADYATAMRAVQRLELMAAKQPTPRAGKGAKGTA
ncbi:MAG: hypothetical protein BWX88_05015 [Planctomycetes bacterium ADurb.Bin126]|nr:MAG: hypothetical protein BWX88_05015 [Planctomycetes bacterium ADurb.Bin126]